MTKKKSKRSKLRWRELLGLHRPNAELKASTFSCLLNAQLCFDVIYLWYISFFSGKVIIMLLEGVVKVRGGEELSFLNFFLNFLWVLSGNF